LRHYENNFDVIALRSTIDKTKIILINSKNKGVGLLNEENTLFVFPAWFFTSTTKHLKGHE